MNQFLLRIAKEQIKSKITDAMPPEKEVAIMLNLYGCTEKEFSEMHELINAPKPTLVKIQNYLRDEIKKAQEG